MMQLFWVYNTSSHWWVVAPDEEIAINYSYRRTSTREKRNLGISWNSTYSFEKIKEGCGPYREDSLPECGLLEMLEGNKVGIVIRVKINEYPDYKWIFTVSDKWTTEMRSRWA